VRLPLATQKQKNSAEQPPAISQQQSRRILVVDDNIDSANSLAMLLRMRGNDVLAAHDGFSALEIANKFAPEVVLLDIGMPGIDGLEVARQLRRMPNTKGAVLIAQTGWGQSEDQRRSVEAGFDYHFTKPVDVEMLQQLMAELEWR
jgi:CheY-like chemotaxis protein